MNICIVNIRENNPYIGGVERVSYVLGEQWMQQGHHVFFLSLVKSDIKSKYISICDEYFLPNPSMATSNENIVFLINFLESNKIDVIINQGSVFPDLCELCKLVRSKISIPLITAIHYAPLCKLNTIKTNFFIKEKLCKNLRLWIHDFLLYVRFKLYKKKFYYNIEKRELCNIATVSDKLVCLSEKFIPEYLEIIGNSFCNKLVAIPNPINTNLAQNKSHKKKQIVYVGRLEFGMKRVDRLIKIWGETENLFPDWNFYIIGDGSARSYFEHTVRNQGLKRIHFEGFQQPDKYYAESSIICLSSSSEGFGMVLVEALRHQCIPIAYNSFAALSDIIEDDINGYCIPPFKEDIFLQKLHYLMNNENERNRLSANHAVTLEKFDLQKVSLQWITLFETLLI